MDAAELRAMHMAATLLELYAQWVADGRPVKGSLDAELDNA